MRKFLSIKPRFDLISRVAVPAVFACAVLTLPACTSMGTGTGTVEPSNAPVTFSWTSKDTGTSGTMSAVVGASGPAGTASGTFSGPFLQVTSSVRTEAFEPMWNGWGRGWNDWGYWGYRGMFPETAFTTHYSGTVVANLKGPGDRLLRCRFHLNAPAAGMNGGGQGECQFNGGRTVDAVFPRS